MSGLRKTETVDKGELNKQAKVEASSDERGGKSKVPTLCLGALEISFTKYKSLT
jgi:hypothetical protein